MTTTTSDPPRKDFHLSQLIYDSRYRSLTIQTVAFILLVAFVFWLVSNTLQNLEALGKDIGFEWLATRAGYDINQKLIPYTSDSTHARAALVGILNTLLVAFLGCLAATIIGVLAGVARLSKNWLVARLMTVYVEGFRNIPLLLWIIAIFAVMTEATPMPRDFREGGSASMLLWDSVAISNRGVYIPAPVWGEGSMLVVVMFLLSLVAIWVWRRYAHARQDRTGEILPVLRVSLALFFLPTAMVFLLLANPFLGSATMIGYATTVAVLAAVYLWVRQRLGGTTLAGIIAVFVAAFAAILFSVFLFPILLAFILGPLVLLSSAFGNPDPSLVWSFPISLDRPTLGGFNFSGGLQLRNSFTALWLALSLYTGAFIAEIVRGGILAISKGQTEAAYALGLRPKRTTNLIILPQAMRVIIPPLISQYLNLTKNSSLAIAVGYMDVRSTLGGISINQTGRELEGMLLLGGFYLLVSLVISGVLNIYNNSVKLKER